MDEAISFKSRGEDAATKFANLEIDIVGYEVSVYGPQSFSAHAEKREKKEKKRGPKLTFEIILRRETSKSVRGRRAGGGGGQESEKALFMRPSAAV